MVVDNEEAHHGPRAQVYSHFICMERLMLTHSSRITADSASWIWSDTIILDIFEMQHVWCCEYPLRSASTKSTSASAK